MYYVLNKKLTKESLVKEPVILLEALRYDIPSRNQT